MSENSSIRSHEDFSITGQLLEITQQWHRRSNLGSLAARAVNLTCTPLTAVIDTVAHLVLGTFTICGGSLVGGTLWNAGVSLAGYQCWSVLRTKGGAINLANALFHIVAMVAAPIIGAIDPELAAKRFKGNQSAVIEALEVQVKENHFIERQKNKAIINKIKLSEELNQIVDLSKTIKNNNKEIAIKDLRLGEQNQKIVALNGQLEELMAEITTLNQQLAAKDVEINRLNDDCKFYSYNSDEESVEAIDFKDEESAEAIDFKNDTPLALTDEKLPE